MIRTIAILQLSIFLIAGDNYSYSFGLNYIYSQDFNVLQYISYMFLHVNWLHLGMNLFMLVGFGDQIEKGIGPLKVLFFYLVIGIGSGMMYSLIQLYTQSNISSPLVGVSGVVYGFIVLYAYLFPKRLIGLYFTPIKIKPKWLVIGLIVYEVASELTRDPTHTVAHIAHISGMAVVFLIMEVMIVYYKSKRLNA